MAKGYLETPRHAASYSVAYPQGRPWSVRARSVVVQLLLAGLALWAAAAAVAALRAAWHAVAAAAGHGTHRAAATKYVLVIDSGSSGTRMHAYNWTLPAGQQHAAAGSSLPVVQSIPPSAAAHLVPKTAKKGLYDRVETQPGLDAFLGSPADLASIALEPLLAWARAVVPPGQHAATPLFLLGTGGLRRLEGHARARLMANVRELLAGSGFRFRDSWARVVGGSEEGMYGWLALNYEQGLLQQQLAAALPSQLQQQHPVPCQ
ncbi:nucleoside phosphatase family-domain-containing protein [Scenedesmus sp. NREL 46B-D3]|nr:nucleoside phosphatase family-domain-containing protein [Scenedesmus sp. NREL 46B-D3]